jgi:hypothetical protein
MSLAESAPSAPFRYLDRGSAAHLSGGRAIAPPDSR